jgi:hypothetical protein
VKLGKALFGLGLILGKALSGSRLIACGDVTESLMLTNCIRSDESITTTHPTQTFLLSSMLAIE